VLIVLVLLVVFIGDAVTTEWFSAYPEVAHCRESNVAGAINAFEGGVDPRELPAPPATPPQAIAEYAPRADPVRGLDPGPFPADGWFEYRGRWIHEWSDRAFLQMWIVETDRGWKVDGYTVFGR